MSKKDDYLELISQRGDRYGDFGGLHSLLIWCNKMNLQQVTEEEARAFFESPNSDYLSALDKEEK